MKAGRFDTVPSLEKEVTAGRLDGAVIMVVNQLTATVNVSVGSTLETADAPSWSRQAACTDRTTPYLHLVTCRVHRCARQEQSHREIVIPGKICKETKST